MPMIDLGLQLEGTHVLVTGGAGWIGSVTTKAFLSAGANVTCLDINSTAIRLLKEQVSEVHGLSEHLLCVSADISNAGTLDLAFQAAAAQFGPVQCCIALASLDLSVLQHPDSILDLDPQQFKRVHEVNVYGTFLTAQTWLRHLKTADTASLKNKSLIIVGSESGLFGERTNPDYASAKSAVQGGLLASLKADVPRVVSGARVNAIAPGPVDTPQFKKECSENPEQLWLDAQATTALGKPVAMKCVARSILYLASEAWSGNVHGQVLRVDSGKEGKLMWRQGELN